MSTGATWSKSGKGKYRRQYCPHIAQILAVLRESSRAVITRSWSCARRALSRVPSPNAARARLARSPEYSVCAHVPFQRHWGCSTLTALVWRRGSLAQGRQLDDGNTVATRFDDLELFRLVRVVRVDLLQENGVLIDEEPDARGALRRRLVLPALVSRAATGNRAQAALQWVVCRCRG